MMKFRENDEAVSPVIGTILMVAITVILAAVIAAFVFGMAGNVQSTKMVAATATQQGSDIIVTYQGGADADELVFLRVSVTPGDDTTAETTYYYWDKDETDAEKKLKSETTLSKALKGDIGKIPVGSTFKGKGSPDRDHVVVAAHFADGSDQVVLDTFV
jgi:flagellin-like protein